MENIITNNASSNIKCIRGLRNIIKSSMHKEKDNNYNIEINNNIDNINDTIYNYNINNYKNGANVTTPDNNHNNYYKKYSNIEEIEIKTNYSKNSLYYNVNTTPVPINKQSKKFNIGPVKLNIKRLILSNRNNNTLDYTQYSNEDKFNNTTESYRKKTFSHSFRNVSKYNFSDEKNNSLSRESKRNTIHINTPKITRYTRKILQNSDSKTKINMKINTNNINNVNDNPINSQRFFIKKNNINDNHLSGINNINEGMTNVTNVTFDTSVRNDLFNFTDINNQNNDKYINKDIEKEIKNKIKENNEIKENILLMMDEINKIKERQEILINYENNNQINNNERNIKISNIIKKTYNFLNDFNRVINEQNQQIYQEIINNLNLFFSN